MVICVYLASCYVLQCQQLLDRKFSVGQVFVLAPTGILTKNWRHFDVLPKCWQHSQLSPKISLMMQASLPDPELSNTSYGLLSKNIHCCNRCPPPYATKESVGIMTTTTDDINSPLPTAFMATCVTMHSRSSQIKSPSTPILPPMDSFATLRELSKTHTNDDDLDCKDDNDQYQNNDDDDNNNDGGGKCGQGTTNNTMRVMPGQGLYDRDDDALLANVFDGCGKEFFLNSR